MGEKPLLIQLCPLWRSPNGLMARFLTMNFVLLIWGVSLTVILFPTTILLCHGEVPCGTIMISQQSPSFANFPSVKFPLEPYVNFRSLIYSYFSSLLSSELHLGIPFSILILIFFWYSYFALLRFCPNIRG